MNENRLISISVASASLHTAIVAFLLGYPGVAIMRFLQHFDPQRADLAYPDAWWNTWLLMPAGFAIGAAFWAALGTLTYNAVARLSGGVRYRS